MGLNLSSFLHLFWDFEIADDRFPAHATSPHHRQRWCLSSFLQVYSEPRSAGYAAYVGNDAPLEVEEPPQLPGVAWKEDAIPGREERVKLTCHVCG